MFLTVKYNDNDYLWVDTVVNHDEFDYTYAVLVNLNTGMVLTVEISNIKVNLPIANASVSKIPETRTILYDEASKDRYIPTCRYGCTDCVLDPAYIKCTSPEWYKELWGDKTPEQAALDKYSCGMCQNGDQYDDEDK